MSHSLRQPFANRCFSQCSVLACSSIPLKKLSILLYCMPDITPTRATVLAVAEQLMRRLSAPPLPAPPPYSSVIPEAAAQSFQAAKCRVCSNKICVDAVSRRVCKCSFCHEAMVKLTCNVVCWSWDKLTCNVVCWSWDKLTCNVVCLAAFSPCDRCHSSLIVLACVLVTGREGGRGLSESTSGIHTMTLYATTMSLACPLLPLCPIASTS